MGLKYRTEDGTSGLYNRACYGYKKDKNGMLIIDEEEARVVRRIYDWYHEGYSIGGIIDKLEEKKIKTSKGKERWSKRAVESTLTREKYTGDVAIADSGGSENRYLYKQHHEGIISKEQFEAVQLEWHCVVMLKLEKMEWCVERVRNIVRKIRNRTWCNMKTEHI